MKKALFLLLTATFVFNCGHNNEIKKKIPAAKFRLADGTPISQDSTDEYNPAVVIDNNSYAILVFGSDRSYSGQAQAGKHNLFIAKSVTPVDFYTGIPAFNTPNVVKISTQALDKNDRINFAVRYVSSSDALEIFYTDSSDSKVKKIPLTSGAISTGIGSSASTILDSLSDPRQGTVLAVMQKTESMVNLLYRSSAGDLVLVDPDDSQAGFDDSLSNQDIGSKSSVSFVPDYVSGVSKSYFFTAWDSTGTSGGQIMAAEGDNPTGAPRLLNEALENNGLVASYVASFTDPYFYLTGFAFSAGSTLDGQQDLYAVNSHDLYGLWLLTLEDFLFIDVPDYFLGTPQIVYANFSSITSSEAVIEIIFDQPVFGDEPQTMGISTASFTSNFGYYNGGQTSTLSVGSSNLEPIYGGSIMGGENSFKLTLQLSGTRTGEESLTFAPLNDTSIYGFAGAMNTASTYQIYFPGALPAPTIMGGFLASNSMAILYFDQAVWTSSGSPPTGGLVAGDFDIIFTQNGGITCTPSITSAYQMDGSTPLSGGENAIALIINPNCGGSPTGSETFEITAIASQIYNGDNTAMDASETTYDMNLIPPPP